MIRCDDRETKLKHQRNDPHRLAQPVVNAVVNGKTADG